VDQSVVFSLLQKNCHYHHIAFLIGVHQMHHHLIALAVDLLLAWPVKVELFEFVSLTTHCDETPGAVINHDRVAVIDDIQRRRLVIELDGRKVGLLRIADVNR
jgi:hypothetical protein